MTFLGRLTSTIRPIGLRYLAACCLIIGLLAFIGCQKTVTPDAGEAPSDELVTTEEMPESGEPVPPGGMAAVEPEEEIAPPEAGLPDARVVLDEMVAAYKGATTYADDGYVAVNGQMDDQVLNMQGSFLTAMARPNKLRLIAYQGGLVSDGQLVWGYIQELPNQITTRDAPAELTIESIFTDAMLTTAMTQGWTQAFSWLPPQVILLFADDPLATLLDGAEPPEMLAADAIGTDQCYRIRLKRPDGSAIIWIDQQSRVLRRFEYPVSELNMALSGGRIQGLSMIAEFANARLDGQIDAAVFTFEAPPNSSAVESFLPPNVAMLGKPAPEFKFLGLDGEEITPQSLAGKVAVLDVWATWCGPCRQSLPILEKVYQKYKDNEKLVFTAVSVDNMQAGPNGPAIADDTLKQTFTDLEVTVPIARDPLQHAGSMFRISGIPSTILLGPDGTVQDLESGLPPDLETALSAKLDAVLAGESIHNEKVEQSTSQIERQQGLFESWLRNQVEEDLFAGPLDFTRQVPTTEIADRAEPESLSVTQLWSCTELQAPGNILVAPGPQGEPRLLVLQDANLLAEIGPDGAVDAMHQIQVSDAQPLRFLRTAVGADGKRYFLVSANGAQHLHLLNDSFEILMSYPQETGENPHAGIADTRFGDLNGDGTLEICVGYWGVVGAQGVSLAGERIWANRSLSTVLQVAVLGAGPEGRRNLMCTNELGTLVVLDSDGEQQGELRVPEFAVHWVMAADLDGDNQPELCGLSPTQEYNFVAVGLNLQGEVLWEYPNLQGVHREQIDRIVAGQVLPDGPGQWLLPAADGTIHVISIDGEQVDRFAYGKPLNGLATAEWDGKRVLLVSTPEGVDAWQIEPQGATTIPVE